MHFYFILLHRSIKLIYFGLYYIRGFLLFHFLKLICSPIFYVSNRRNSPFFSPPRLPPHPLLLHFPSEKASQGYQPNMTYQVTIRLGTSPHNQTEQGNPEKTPQGMQQSQRQPWLPLLEFHKNTKLHIHNIQAEGLGKSPAVSMIVGSVSVSPYMSRFIVSVCFLVLSLTILTSTIFLPPPLLLQDSQSYI